jgi:hypothetical protein
LIAAKVLAAADVVVLGPLSMRGRAPLPNMIRTEALLFWIGSKAG